MKKYVLAIRYQCRCCGGRNMAHSETPHEYYFENILKKAHYATQQGRGYMDGDLVIHPCIPCQKEDCDGIAEAISSVLGEVEDEDCTKVGKRAWEELSRL